jgi:hypothetical protein
MQLGIVADTHDDLALVSSAVDLFEAEAVDAVVHCGDFVAPFSAAPFGRDWAFYAVRGNNDGEWALQDVVDEFGSYLGEMGELTLDGCPIAVYHGTSQPIVEALVDCGRYDYVLHGHTHDRAHEERDGTVRINPGGVGTNGAGGDPAGVVVDLATGDVTFHDLQ